jgi:lipopolysaccharide transport system permease protein
VIWRVKVGELMSSQISSRFLNAGHSFVRMISPTANLRAIRDFGGVLRSMRELIIELTRRDMGSAHAGHGLGNLWVYTQPLLIVLIYLFIFGFVIGSRIAITDSFPGDYPSYIIIGLVPWLAIQACLVKSTGALTGASNLVKQVVFPIEVLPISAAMGASLPFLPALGIALLYKQFFGGGLPLTALLLPLVILMQLALCLGLAFALAALTCFIRDLREVVGVFCLVAMYVTPAVYLPEWVPEAFRPLLYFNPFSYLTWVYQDTLFFGEIRHPEAWWTVAVMSVVSLSLGFRLFKKLKPFYGNVI